MAAKQYEQLTQQDVDHFLQHGWIKLTSCFTKEQASEMTSTVWTRLGMSPTDKSTWHTERINMPSHDSNSKLASAWAPKAWVGICDLVGGDDRIADHNRKWHDSLIVNLGTPEGGGKEINGRDLPGWHVDGDFFVHYLDSPEQGLLVIPLFTDIAPGGGGTMICPAAIPIIAKHLRDQTEGVSPRMTPRAQNPTFEPEPSLQFYCDIAKSMPENAFVEATGNVGDVYLLHPLMLHSASNNQRRELRIITNPPIGLKEPFCFDRDDAAQYSVVERKTLQALGVEKLEGWKVEANREEVVPERIRKQNLMKAEELRRLEVLKMGTGVTVTEIASVPGTLDNFT